jgi:hypothetical protein
MKKTSQYIFGIDIKSILPIILELPYLRLIMASVITFGITYKVVTNISIEQLEEPKSSTTLAESFTRAEYQRIQIGMSLIEVETILGRGIGIQQTTNRETFIWKNSNGSTITAIFEKGKLINKQQSEL